VKSFSYFGDELDVLYGLQLGFKRRDVYLTVLRRSFVRTRTSTTPVQTGFGAVSGKVPWVWSLPVLKPIYLYLWSKFR